MSDVFLKYFTSDNTLDKRYAQAYDAKNQADITRYGMEILDRLASPLSFIEGIAGFVRFPLYTARSGSIFNQVGAAQGSVTAQAGAVAESIGGAGYTILLPLGLIIILVLILQGAKWK